MGLPHTWSRHGHYTFFVVGLLVSPQLLPAQPVVPAGDEFVVPSDPTEIAKRIGVLNESVRDLVATGALTEIYLPALRAKRLAVALESYIDSRPLDDQRTLGWAVKQLVRAAWLLDGYGDLGDRRRGVEAYYLFDEAVEEIRKRYP